MERLKIVSLFCGCGGMDLGALGGFTSMGKEYSRHNTEVVYAADFDEYCTKIYNQNFEHKCIVKDVRQIKNEDIPECDMLLGGFPCQSFSISAQNPPRLGYKDERGMLFFEMVKILKAKRPRFFIAENVKGLLSANKGKAFPMIIQEFEAAGYTVVYKLLNASEYGVPQKRERVIIIGFKNPEDAIKFRYPNRVKASDRRVLKDAIIESNNEDEKLFFSDRAVAGMMAVREKMNKGRAMSLDEPCNTVSAHLAKVSLNSTDPVFMVGERFRRFSPREAANIQSFPTTFKLDSVSQCRQYKAIGNAVPPILMWHVVSQIERTIFSLTPSTKSVVTQEKHNIEEPTKKKNPSYMQLDFFDLFDQYADNPIVENCMVREDTAEYGYGASTPAHIIPSKNCLISLVKKDNFEQYVDQSAKIYYTGKKFPSTVALNKLYYFMPYLKGKGIRDLYFIKIARVGTRKEGQPGEDKNDFRLVFEIEFVKQLFDDYKPVELKIWRTFTDTTMEEVSKLKDT